MFRFNKSMSYIWVALTFDFRPVFLVRLDELKFCYFQSVQSDDCFSKNSSRFEYAEVREHWRTVQSEFIHL